MNPQQRRRAAEAADEPAAPGVGHWIAGGPLTIGAMRYPRGAVVPHETVRAIPPHRLDILRSNRRLVHRLTPPENAPAPESLEAPDPEAERAAIQAAMRRNGYAEYELDHRAKAPPGAYRPAHPAASIVVGDPVSNVRRP
jgi:hypothetical protein